MLAYHNPGEEMGIFLVHMISTVLPAFAAPREGGGSQHPVHKTQNFPVFSADSHDTAASQRERSTHRFLQFPV